VGNIPCLESILPGLSLMSVITGSYGNTSFNLFGARRERYIDDILISPMAPLQMALAYVLGSTRRASVGGAQAVPALAGPPRAPERKSVVSQRGEAAKAR
jgi:ABC-2 type transport system permease protein